MILALKIKFCLIFGIFLGTLTLAQQPSKATNDFADSLQRLVNQAPNDSARIERLFDLSFFWSDRDTSKAFQYIARARREMGMKPSDYQEGLILHFKANVVYTHNIEKAKNYYLRADQHLSKYSFPRAYFYRAKAWNNYGTLLQIQDSADRYMKILIGKAIPYARLAGDSIAVGNNLQNIGLLLSNVQDHKKAGFYFDQAVHTLSKFSKAHEDKLTVFVNASKNALLNGQQKKARVYLDSAAFQLSQIPHSNYAPYYFRSEGVYYRKLKQKAKALEKFQRGIAVATEIADEYSLRDINFEIYATYRDFGEYAKAKKYLAIANNYTPNSSTHDRLLHRREMAYTEYKLGNYKAAYEQMNAYALGKDTFQEKNMALQILDLEKKYQTVEKENEILKLQDTNQKQQLAIDRNKQWSIILFSGLAVALIIAYLSWKLAVSNRKALAQNYRLHQEELLSLRQQEQLLQLKSILQGQEEERNRISRDLHDGLGGLLAGIKLRLSSIATKAQKTTVVQNSEIESVILDVDHSADELRRVARNMMPEALILMGLKPALADLCKYIDTPQTSVKFLGYDLQCSYPQPILIGVYRIVQELVNNAMRHAQAKQIIVQCSESDNYLFLIVEDDGCGFDQAKMVSSGMGLKNIKSRVALLHGKLEIESSYGQGTAVNIEIPL